MDNFYEKSRATADASKAAAKSLLDRWVAEDTALFIRFSLNPGRLTFEGHLSFSQGMYVFQPRGKTPGFHGVDFVLANYEATEPRHDTPLGTYVELYVGEPTAPLQTLRGTGFGLTISTQALY